MAPIILSGNHSKKIMETRTKRNITLWVVVLLIVLNISSLATIWYHRYQFSQRRSLELPEQRLNRRADAMNRRMRQMPPFLIKDLALSAKQQATLDSIWSHYNGQRRILEDSMDRNRVSMFSVMMAERLDTGRYEELSEKQSQIMRELNSTMLGMNRAIRVNLTDEQQEILTERMQDIRTRMPRENRHRARK